MSMAALMYQLNIIGVLNYNQGQELCGPHEFRRSCSIGSRVAEAATRTPSSLTVLILTEPLPNLERSFRLWTRDRCAMHEVTIQFWYLLSIF